VRRPWASEPTPRTGRLWLPLLAVIALAVLTWAVNQGGGFSGGGRDGDADPVATTVSASALPVEARAVLALIDQGGPFPYDRDGVVFENRERLLPDEPLGYYHEYTVPTPGSPDRGARRIITGTAGELYWTDDHYRSFERIKR
jgi:ribonuclease T1